ncbi:MFS transporter [Micromonospora polyrhachis]|uniref:DHA2 family multidrug resistance protein-like MFS transporter n=1 Tax=Micromonospora polyrhachis TaxID=1282883 RepID=A0A7W7SPB5_9ACTN|nr:MFS transporter [Micromonospora polyrhachis]MBB4958091.1 DHA2 family multidrug resistance protein-like MFS transporter [Micromonospora polyrhachis]
MSGPGTNVGHPGSDATAAERATWREWTGLALLVLPMLILSTDLTVLFFALPTLSADLQPTATQTLWIVHVYGFLIAGFLVTMGRLGDRVGPRRLLLTGAAAFAAMSAVAAFSVSTEMLIAARALLGIAGATLMPSLFSLLRTMFRDDQERRLAIAIMFSSFSVGAAVGPLLGGLLLTYFWWGSVFLINVPPILLLLLVGPRLLPERPERTPVRLDVASVALSVIGMLAVVYGLQELAAGQETDTGSIWPKLASIAVGVVVLTLFVRRQRRLRDPLLDLALLTNRPVAASLATLLLVGVGVVGVFYLFTQYLQWVVGLSPLQAGLWTLPYIVVNIVGAMLAPALAARFRPATVIAGGLVIAALATMLVVVATGTGAPLALLVAATSVIGLGQGAANALVSDLIIANAPAEQTGSAAAAQEVGGELGAALGLAAGGAISMLAYRAALSDTALPEVPESATRAAESSIHEGVAAAEGLTAEGLAAHGSALLGAVRDAVTHGLQIYAGVGAALVAGAAVLVTVVLVMRKGEPTPHD